MKKRNGWLILFILCVLSMQGCSREPKLKNSHLITATPAALSNVLYYSGTIQPLKTLVIPSPADGVVVEMPFQYGETIQSGQLLFLLSSAKFLTDYKSALMTYLKAKSDFNGSDSQLTEAKFLHQHQLISDDDYKMKQSNYYGARLALLQAKDTLENLLHQLDIKDVNVYNLTVADFDKVNQALHLQMNSEHLRILAPAAGVVLSPAKGEDETKKLAKGETIKQGDVLAMIGDMSGISVRIKVNELVINQLKVGQKIKVTGIAFPGDVLAGEIKRVDRQGETTSGGLPTFAVEVMVPKLTLEQQKHIHVGMSAKVEISVDEDKQLMVPITAIVEHQGESFIKVFDKQAGKIREQKVLTGKTTMDSVAILSGLKAGDRLVVPNTA